MSKNNIFIYNVDRVCNHKAQDLNLDKIKVYHLLPGFKFYFQQADIFGVFKGSKVKVLKSRFKDIEEFSIWNRLDLMSILEILQEEQVQLEKENAYSKKINV